MTGLVATAYIATMSAASLAILSLFVVGLVKAGAFSPLRRPRSSEAHFGLLNPSDGTRAVAEVERLLRDSRSFWE